MVLITEELYPVELITKEFFLVELITEEVKKEMETSEAQAQYGNYLFDMLTIYLIW